MELINEQRILDELKNKYDIYLKSLDELIYLPIPLIKSLRKMGDKTFKILQDRLEEKNLLFYYTRENIIKLDVNKKLNLNLLHFDISYDLYLHLRKYNLHTVGKFLSTSNKLLNGKYKIHLTQVKLIKKKLSILNIPEDFLVPIQENELDIEIPYNEIDNNFVKNILERNNIYTMYELKMTPLIQLWEWSGEKTFIAFKEIAVKYGFKYIDEETMARFNDDPELAIHESIDKFPFDSNEKTILFSNNILTLFDFLKFDMKAVACPHELKSYKTLINKHEIMTRRYNEKYPINTPNTRYKKCTY